jgi:hypothetical protein
VIEKASRRLRGLPLSRVLLELERCRSTLRGMRLDLRENRRRECKEHNETNQTSAHESHVFPLERMRSPRPGYS